MRVGLQKGTMLPLEQSGSREEIKEHRDEEELGSQFPCLNGRCSRVLDQAI